MQRRSFIKVAGAGAGATMIPVFGNPVDPAVFSEKIPIDLKRKLADIALATAKGAGASYSDVRIGRYLNQFVISREMKIQNIVNTESVGVGIRVIANGTYGFAATHDLSEKGVKEAANRAVAIAKANSKFQTEAVQLAPNPGHGEVSWQTPIEKNAMEVPLKEKVDMLLGINKKALDNGADYVNSQLFLVNEQKYFASSEGSFIDQDIHRLWAPFTVTGIDKTTGKFRTRDGIGAPVGMGYEYLDGKPEHRLEGITPRYTHSYNILEDMEYAARQVKEKLKAKSVEPGQYDLVLDPTHTFLTIHESVGHPLELDRVLGYEANYAGTSFATLDKWKTKAFNYGSKKVNLFADKTQKGSLGAVGFDDEGVQTKQWDLVKDGVLVNYQAIRDQVHMIDQKESHGCCYADSWDSIQFQRMPNVSLAPGKDPLTVEEMIKDVEKGIYIIGRGSYSIDQQRYNFQFGGQLFYEIKDGKITGMLEDVAYQSNTQEFWNAMTQVCDERDYQLGGSFFDGKGEPGQISAVSHGSSTARFEGIKVINTARNIG